MLLLDKNSGEPLYRQVYEQIRQQILREELPAGQRLPATRELAGEYGLSRNTVIRAYRQLELEGYLRAAEGSGHYVENLSSFRVEYAVKSVTYPDVPKPEAAKSWKYSFEWTALDSVIYRSSIWRRSLLDASDRLGARTTASYAQVQGDPELRRALTSYLHRVRGVICEPEQIIITCGHHASLRMLAEMFGGSGRDFAMEDPGYNVTRRIMEQQGFDVHPVPVEKDGISLRVVSELPCCLLYITPSHQFPMGCTLPISKRLALLEWADRTDSYLIEDDYDSELRYYGSPIPSVQSVDPVGRTIYLGSFSRTLSPDLRMAYMVLPPALAERWQECCGSFYGDVPSLLQLTVAKLIEDGDYQRQLHAIRTQFKRKHDLICSRVQDRLGDRAELLGKGAGLHLILRLRTEQSQEHLVKALAARSINVCPTEPFWIHREFVPYADLILGFGGIRLGHLSAGLDALTETLLEVM